MFNIFRKLSLGIAVLLLSGCATEFSMTRSMAGVGARYGDLAAHEETQLGEIHESTTTLYNLCNSYLNMRGFSKLAVCLVRMEARIAKGDKDIVYPTWIGRTNGMTALYNMRTEANLEPAEKSESMLGAYEIGNAGREVVSPHKSAAFTRVHFVTHGKFQTEDIVEDRRKS